MLCEGFAGMNNAAHKFGETALTLGVGALGGAIWWAVGLPAPWLSGSALFAGAAALARLPMALPSALSSVCFILVGVSMGAGFKADMLEQVAKWPLSLVFLALSVPTIIGAVALYLRRFSGWDAPTALFASIPGALSYVVAMTMNSRADATLVVMAQMVRLMILMALLPPVIVALNGAEPVAPPVSEESARLAGPAALAVLIATGAAAGLLLNRLRVPAGLLLGAMIASATLHLTGAVAGQLPGYVLAPTLIVLGAFVGIRFKGASFEALLRSLPASFIAFLVALAVSTAFALATAWTLNLPVGQALVAFAPGGLDAMIVLSFILGLDPAYVGTHQFLRFLGIAMLLPLFAKPYLSKSEAQAVMDKTDPDD